jgi:hypothetical protein
MSYPQYTTAELRVLAQVTDDDTDTGRSIRAEIARREQRDGRAALRARLLNAVYDQESGTAAEKRILYNISGMADEALDRLRDIFQRAEKRK